MGEPSAEAATVLRQIDNKGFAGYEDLLRLVNVDIPVFGLLADSLQVSPADVKEQAERQKISPEQVRAAIG